MTDFSEGEPFFEFTWTISNFRLCRNDRGEFFDSPTFVVQFLQDTEWYMRLHPMESDATVTDSLPASRDSVNSIACFLHRTNFGVDSIGVQYSIRIEDSSCEARQTFRKKSISDKCVKVSSHRYFRMVAVGRPDNLKVTCYLKPTRFQESGISQAPYPPVCCSAVTTVPVERRKICWRIADFCTLPSQHEVTIPVVSASPASPKLLVTLSWSDQHSDDEPRKGGGGLVMEIREMPELVGKNFKLLLDVHLVKKNSKRRKLEGGVYLFKTVQKNYWLWVSKYSDSVWDLNLGIDRGSLRQYEDNLQEGALVLECDFALSCDPVTSHVVSSGYVHAVPETSEVRDVLLNGWREELLRNFNDQTSVFKFFFMLFVFLAVISRVFRDNI